MPAPADVRDAPEFIPSGCVEASINDEASEAAGWVVRTLLFPLLEAGWQGEGLSINGCTERLEGMSPTCVEVGGIEPLQESHMVEALGLWDR